MRNSLNACQGSVKIQNRKMLSLLFGTIWPSPAKRYKDLLGCPHFCIAPSIILRPFYVGCKSFAVENFDVESSYLHS